MLNTTALKRFARTLLRTTVLAVLLVGVAVVVNAQTSSPVTSPTTTTPFAGDDRACGDIAGDYAQTAAIYHTTNANGKTNGLLMYEINDQGMGTYVGDIANHPTIDNALTKAQTSGAPVTFFTTDTYTVSALPSGLCQFDSTQIPIEEGKPYVCTFTCN